MPPLHAFTLIEVVIVITVVGLLAVTAIPAMDSLTQTRRQGAVREVERRLTIARDLATTTGQPAGVAINNTSDTLQLVCIAQAGAAPTPVTTSSGEPAQPFSIPAEFAGVTITALNAGDGSTGDTTIWFSFEGVPQIRTSTGTLVSGFTQDAWVEVTGPIRVYIRKESGLVER